MAEPLAATSPVAYTTANGSVAAGSEYQAASGVLTILAGQTTGTVTVLVIGDRPAEPTETFVVNLSARSTQPLPTARGSAPSSTTNRGFPSTM